METTSFTSDSFKLEYNYERASTGKRFTNYLIDAALFYLFIFSFGVLVGLFFPSALEWLDNPDPLFNIFDRIFSLILYAIYISFIEAVFKGKTLGKAITKTRAVNLDGSQISTATAFGRGFCRAIPFAVFSALGNPCNPWHDSLTKTMVIDEKKTTVKM